ncbi:hypothetical protein [Amycolatopsis thermoflava]|uniref:hypothetical protein n=1 Tax=Amycolatopsis thermoflava TaxID=84480 RepID=UPI00381424B2
MTAVPSARVGDMKAVYDSIASQRLPRGWQWEWVVQHDGRIRAVEELPLGDERVRGDACKHSGGAEPWNLALHRAVGELVRVLDADAVLTPGALAGDIEKLAGDNRLGWTACRATTSVPSGRVEREWVYDHWRTHDFSLPLDPATMCFRRDLAVSLGGWSGIPGSEGVMLAIAAGMVSAGFVRQEPGLVRSGDAPGCSDELDSVSVEAIRARAEALRRLIVPGYDR